MISTRGRYALRIMIDLGEHRESGYVPIKEVARRQGISLKYIERIMPLLTRAGLVAGVQGKGGGYRLCQEPSACSVGRILRAAEGSMAPVACLDAGTSPCARSAECRTLSMWQEYYRLTNAYFDGIPLSDLMRSPES